MLGAHDLLAAQDLFGTHDLYLFVGSGLLLNVTPGPDTLYIVGRSSSQGSRAGAVAALGIGTGALVHICAAALGLSALLAASAAAFTAVKIIGAAYLVYVGISLIRSHSASQSAATPANDLPVQGRRRKASMRGIFFQGFLTNVLNPKVALFFLWRFCRNLSPPMRFRNPWHFCFSVRYSISTARFGTCSSLGRRRGSRAGWARAARSRNRSIAESAAYS